MTKGITDADLREDARTVYADIIDLPHHRSETHPHMSLYDRAAQFLSYKALSGYEDMITEESRRTDREVQLEEADLEELDRRLGQITQALAAGGHPAVTFTVFRPDDRKAGGRYEEITDRVKRIDTAARSVVLMSRRERSGVNKTIPIDRIVDICPEAEAEQT